MLSKDAMEDLKKDYTFEEIQKISISLRKVREWKVLSKKQVKNFIDNDLFSKYSINV